ncbi:MAG: hypothetical protein PHQ86_06555 [Dehalococcoidales bacterium]|jgi:hypothetical protein|nr:hypothetical protein [Dehalococcoidales bacterium]
MKIIAEQYYYALVDEILKEKQQQAHVSSQPFIGVTDEELQNEIGKRLGKPWAVEIRKVTLSVKDVNALAGARFFAETGRSLLMALAIIILALSVGVKYIPNMTALYYNLYYTLCGAVALIFIYIYSHKQAKIRKEFKWKYGVRDTEEDK